VTKIDAISYARQNVFLVKNEFGLSGVLRSYPDRDFASLLEIWLRKPGRTLPLWDASPERRTVKYRHGYPKPEQGLWRVFHIQ
jgi:hypothetical protein